MISHVWRPYTQMKTAPAPFEVVRTEGVHIELADGRVLVDGIASWWTACHGYCHPALMAAARAQLDSGLPHVMFGGLTHQPAELLAKRLVDLLPGDLDHVFFAESGSVSVEIAMKMAIQRQQNRGAPGRYRFVSFEGGYHGDTFAAMSVCDPEEGMHTRFRGALLPQYVLPVPTTPRAEQDLDYFCRKHQSELAGIIIEPRLQAAGGMRLHEPQVLEGLRKIADRYDLLLIFDEIATGFGRTGSMFACESAGVLPDVITLSKALTGGVLPLSAAIARRHVFDAFYRDDADSALMHGPTYMANPLGCRVALASLELFETEPRREQVARIQDQLTEGLGRCRRMTGVSDVRVLGAMGVVELDHFPNLDALRTRFVDEGCWIRPLGRAVYLMPALTIGPDDLDRLMAAIRRVVTSL